MANILETLAKIGEKGLRYSDAEGKLFSEEGITSLLKKEYLDGIKNDTQDLTESFEKFKDRQIGLRFTNLSKISSGISDMLHRKGFYGDIAEIRKSLNAIYGYADTNSVTVQEGKNSEPKTCKTSEPKTVKKDTSEKKKKPREGGEQ